MPAPPDYIYPGQAFDELGSLATLIPKYPAMALNISALPGSRDAINTFARAIMQSNIPPYGE